AWNLIPPSPPDDIFFGFELNGKEGETGFFRMKIPDTLIDHLSELAGKTLNVDDLAIFNDGKQASLDIEDLSDGIIVNIKTVFKEGFNLAPPPPMQQEPAKGFLSKGGDSSSGLTKTYSVGEREDSTSDGGVAATVKTSTVKKTAKLTAVVSTGLSAGQTIKVKKRVLTSSGKKTWRTVKSVSVPDNKTQEKFKVKVSKGGESPNSSTYTYRAKGTDSNKRKKFSITVTD
ncbi:MAG: hypothetical protein KDD53_06440, partial [Bdellovibrionales bacterium]|nr:hypothetical protein [Bdellovibrionales bacterium]